MMYATARREPIVATSCHELPTIASARKDGKVSPQPEEPRPATIYDVARIVGVSASTVSRAFARPGRVSFATAERIRKVADEIGYQSVSVRRPMAQGRSRRGTIALVVADISNPVYFEMIRGAEEEAALNGYTMLLAHTRESGVIEREAIERSIDIVDGIVLSSSRMSDAAIRAMAKQKPTVVMNRGVKGVASVITDNVRGVRRAIEHFAQLGHREVSYLAGPEASWADSMRWRAVKQAGQELDVRITKIESTAPTMDGGAQVADKVATGKASAVLAYNDQLALGLMRRLQANGFGIPEDFSIIGFDNSSGASLIVPGLSSVAAPLHALGATAVRSLLAISRGAVSAHEQAVVLPTRLVLRGSTARPRG